jgi:hypothetical protein
MAMSFREYIRIRRHTDNPQGDFVEDARGDPNFPDVKTWDEMEGYLRHRSASHEAIAAARVVWRQYQLRYGGQDA